MAPLTAATRPPRKGPRFRQTIPWSGSGDEGETAAREPRPTRRVTMAGRRPRRAGRRMGGPSKVGRGSYKDMACTARAHAILTSERAGMLPSGHQDRGDPVGGDQVPPGAEDHPGADADRD